MNLKRLLTVGGSLESRKGASSRYRMAPTGVLPKFELRGDTLTAVPMEGVVPSAKTPAKQSPGPLFDGLSGMAAPAGKPSVKAAVAEPPVPAAVPADNPFAAESAGKRVKIGFWRMLFGAVGSVLSDAFSGRRNRMRKRASRETVQGELGLDSVKPLRNDLSGTDFEVVAAPVPGRTGLVVRESSVPAPDSKPTVPTRTEERLLGAED